MVNSVFFSPTGTTRAVLEGIAKGTGKAVGKIVDLTCAAEAAQFNEDDLVVVGMPVYAGRLPALAVERFSAIQGGNARVAAVVVYGNRAYDDALLELCDLCTAQGFRVVGAAAFIGEHSFSSAETPIAQNRPDDDDLKKAEEFGRRMADKTEALDLSTIPGKRPYKEGMTPMGAAAESDAQACTQCGACADVCPAGAIKATSEGVATDAVACIWCEACVRACPNQARLVNLPKVQEIAVRLHEMCSARCEPEWFVAE